MNIENIINERIKQSGEKIDFAFLTDQELDELEQLLSNNPTSKRCTQLIEKATGDVVLTWLRQTSTKGKSFDDLYKEYRQFVDENNYSNEYRTRFKERLTKAGVKYEN